MANNYTTSTDAFADISEGSYNDADFPQMATFVATASRLIDLECGRWEGFFYPSTDTTTRYYDGSGDIEQEIDEFASITTVSVAETGGTASTDYTDWTSTDYFTYPYNQANDGKPITKLIIDENGSKPEWYAYRKAVKIVGIAGYSTSIPSPIAHAARIQSVRWFMRAKAGYQDTGGSVDFGQMRFSSKLELDPDVRQLLHPYKLELMR